MNPIHVIPSEIVVVGVVVITVAGVVAGVLVGSAVAGVAVAGVVVGIVVVIVGVFVLPASIRTQRLFSATNPALQEHWPAWQTALAGQAYPHPPQLAASFRVSAEQAAGAVVPAAAGEMVPASTGSDGAVAGAGVPVVIMRGPGPVLWEQPAAIIMKIINTFRKTGQMRDIVY